jgi:hypothetical protein
MATTVAKLGTFRTIVDLANPIFIIASVGLPIGALIVAISMSSLTYINFVHIMAGCLWTGIDLAMSPVERVAVFRRLMPKMTFLMPVIAGVTTTAGFEVTQRLGMLSLDNPRILASLIIVTVLTVQGFAILLPNEIRIFKELLSDTPNTERISKLGMINAKLGGIQGLFQLAIIFAMATLRF